MKVAFSLALLQVHYHRKCKSALSFYLCISLPSCLARIHVAKIGDGTVHRVIYAPPPPPDVPGCINRNKLCDHWAGAAARTSCVFSSSSSKLCNHMNHGFLLLQLWGC